MTKRSVAAPARTTNPLDEIADRVEQEIAHLREKRPHLEDRIDRASHILVVHLSCPRSRMIRVRIVANGRSKFLVNGSGGNVYTVDPETWSCSCPDHHRRNMVCKHGLSCYVLNRAARPVGVRLRDCDGCQQPFPRGELVEVHENERYFPGDRICRGCADRAGVER